MATKRKPAKKKPTDDEKPTPKKHRWRVVNNGKAIGKMIPADTEAEARAFFEKFRGPVPKGATVERQS